MNQNKVIVITNNAKHRVFIQLASVESFCKTIQFVFIFCIILTPSHAYQQKNPYEKTSILSHWLADFRTYQQNNLNQKPVTVTPDLDQQNRLSEKESIANHQFNCYEIDRGSAIDIIRHRRIPTLNVISYDKLLSEVQTTVQLTKYDPSRESLVICMLPVNKYNVKRFLLDDYEYVKMTPEYIESYNAVFNIDMILDAVEKINQNYKSKNEETSENRWSMAKNSIQISILIIIFLSSIISCAFICYTETKTVLVDQKVILLNSSPSYAMLNNSIPEYLSIHHSIDDCLNELTSNHTTHYILFLSYNVYKNRQEAIKRLSHVSLAVIHGDEEPLSLAQQNNIDYTIPESLFCELFISIIYPNYKKTFSQPTDNNSAIDFQTVINKMSELADELHRLTSVRDSQEAADAHRNVEPIEQF